MVCAFTGHRTHRLPWGSRESDPRCEALKILLGRKLLEAVELGCTTFLCGMARGCDTYFAEAVMELRAQRPELRLVAMLPCADQADRWPADDRDRHRLLCDCCDEVVVLEPRYSDGCMLRRNRAMVDRADLMITVFDGCRGGTASTVAYAKRRGLRLLPVWV